MDSLEEDDHLVAGTEPFKSIDMPVVVLLSSLVQKEDGNGSVQCQLHNGSHKDGSECCFAPGRWIFGGDFANALNTSMHAHKQLTRWMATHTNDNHTHTHLK